ncbi:MAG TPA: ABC transporter permease subunit, partial [Trueperaceae bacterium]
MKRAAKMGPARPAGAAAELLLPTGGLLIGNAVVTLLGLWQGYWWGILLVDFVLLVMLAERLEARVPLRRQRAYKLALALGFPVLLLVAWQLIVGAGILNPRWFPPPTTIGRALWDLAVGYDRFNETSLLGRPWLIPSRLATQGWPGVGALFAESHLWATLGRVLAGFFIGALPGVLLGIVMGINRTVRTMLDSTLSAVYVLPKIAIFPLMMLIFPNPFGEGPKIAVVAISAFFLVAISTMAGVQGIEPVYLQAGRNYGANRWQLFWHVIVPGA